ncbi:MAG: hypothetical protein AAB586_01440 [Patescibacteria group bacterium]
MEILALISWRWIMVFIGSIFGILFLVLCSTAVYIGCVSRALYPSGIPDVDDDEQDKPSMTWTLGIGYVSVLLVLSGVLALSRSYFPDWTITLRVTFFVLVIISCLMATDLKQWDFRSWPWRFGTFISRLKKMARSTLSMKNFRLRKRPV